MKKHRINDPIYNAIEVFHDRYILLPKRILYFGSINSSKDGCGETGVDFEATRILMKNLIYLSSESGDPITLHFNSPGGDWHHGIAIYDLIKHIKPLVTMVGYGYVRSMGTIIMQACRHRYLMSNCGFMIHDGEESFSGDAKAMISNAKESEYILNKMHRIYYTQIRKKYPKRYKLKDIEKMCVADYFMRPEQAVALGLADKVLQ